MTTAELLSPFHLAPVQAGPKDGKDDYGKDDDDYKGGGKDDDDYKGGGKGGKGDYGKDDDDYKGGGKGGKDDDDGPAEGF
jgi:hypothetical protein